MNQIQTVPAAIKNSEGSVRVFFISGRISFFFFIKAKTSKAVPAARIA